MKKRLKTTFAAAGAMLVLAAGSARAEDKRLEIKGYLQEMYAAASNSSADSYSMRLARIVFSGKPSVDWAYTFQIDALAATSLLDGYLDFSREKILPEPFTFRLRAGQFKVPFSLESLASDSELDTVNRSQAVNALAPGRDTGTKGRDIGAALQLTASPWNSKKLAEVSIGQFNGEGANTADKNDQKGLALRAVITPGKIVSVGGSYYDGERSSTATISGRAGAELMVNYAGLCLKTEYIRGRDAAVKKEGWYAQLSGYALPALQLVGKYDVFDPDLKKRGDKTGIAVAGVNWYFAGSMRLQTNYEWKYKIPSGIVSNTFETVLALTF